jgi:hypothetical protein
MIAGGGRALGTASLEPPGRATAADPKLKEEHMAVRIRAAPFLAAAIVVVAAVLPALAADPRLDQCRDHLVKAAALVEAAATSSTQKPYGQHVKRAQDLIGKAIREIDLAKLAADAAPVGTLLRLPQSGVGVTVSPQGLIQLNPQPEPPSSQGVQ